MTGRGARDRGATVTDVTSGGQIRLPYAEVRAMADAYDRAGHDARSRAAHAAAIACSPHLLASTPFSPSTAAAAEAAIAAIGGALSLWSVEIGFDADSVRRAAAFLSMADAEVHATLRALEVVLAGAYGREGVPPDVSATDLRVEASSTAPADLPALIEHVGQLSELSDGDHSENKGTIEVQTITGTDGTRRHIVYLPGLDDLVPDDLDGDVRDLPSAIHLEAGMPTAYGAGVVQALHDAGVGPDEQVLAVGHSQGGMQAAALAVHGTPYHLTEVVTAGSPVVPGRLPPWVHLLSLEHQGDAIPLVDAGAADHSPNHVTVTFDSGVDLNPMRNHDFPNYVAGAHAAQHSADPVVQQAITGLDPFLAQPGDQVASTVFQIQRGDGVVPLSPILAVQAAIDPVGTAATLVR